MLYLSVTFIIFASVVYKLLLKHNLRHNLTADPIVGHTDLNLVYYLLIMLYLSVKFQCDIDMPPKFLGWGGGEGGHKKSEKPHFEEY